MIACGVFIVIIFILYVVVSLKYMYRTEHQDSDLDLDLTEKNNTPHYRRAKSQINNEICSKILQYKKVYLEFLSVLVLLKSFEEHQTKII